MADAPIITINPATGTELARYRTFDAEQLEAALGQAHAASGPWAATSADRRAACLRPLADVLRSRQDELAALMTTEMGKPVRQAVAEIEKCAWVCEYYAGIAAHELADEIVETGQASWIGYEPLGTVLAIMPWNFPLWQVFRFGAPTLAAGNTAMLKHSPNVTGCALEIEQLFRKAGFPDGVFRTLLIAEADVPSVAEQLLSDDRISAVSITGSAGAGAAVAAAAGRNVKKAILELGGSDPFVVLDDADVGEAVAGAVRSRFLNSGQSCLAAKRFIVHKGVVDEFTERFAAEAAGLVVGDPAAPETQVGPLARADLRDTLNDQVRRAVAAGARVVTGGQVGPRPGAWYEPTVLTGLVTDSPVLLEETFGPVAAIVPVADDEAAVAVANCTRYGLAASVWSRDSRRALSVGRRIRSGALFVNSVAASDPRLPFGGVKDSGYGRELGRAGLKEFVNVRTYVLGSAPVAAEPGTKWLPGRSSGVD